MAGMRRSSHDFCVVRFAFPAEASYIARNNYVMKSNRQFATCCYDRGHSCVRTSALSRCCIF